MALVQISRAQAQAAAGRGDRMDEAGIVIVQYERREDFANEIGNLWTQAQTKFLAIGRYLVNAHAKLGHGTWMEMVKNDLPFGYQTAYKFRKIAEAVNAGLLTNEAMPQDYNAAYELAQLKEPDFAAAREQDLIRPDITRRLVLAFKRRRQSAEPGPTDGRATASKVRRLASLRAKRIALDRQIAELEAELG